VDGLGNIVIAATTNSTGYPTRNAIQGSLAGMTDAAVTKIGDCAVNVPLD
jgi:hypothetical protein